MDDFGALFAQALQEHDLETLRTIPKTDLHCHGSLSMRRSSLAEWAGAEIPDPPAVFPTFGAFISYIKQHLHPHTDHAHGLQFCLLKSLEEASADGVVYAEMSIDLKFIDFHTSMEKFLQTISNVIDMTRAYIEFSPEIGIKRTHQPALIQDSVYALVDSGLFKSIDLYDDELAGDVTAFKDLFKYAKSMGLKLKAHTGEYHTAQSVAHCVETLELDAIQHGIHAADDPGVMRMLAERKIPLHICPTSNVALQRIDQIRNHPIRKLYDEGVLVTINSDDVTLFNQSVSEEMLLLFEEGVFSAEELNQIRIQGLLHRL